MARSRPLRACALLAITLSAFGVGCGAAPSAPETPPVEIAPAPSGAPSAKDEPVAGSSRGLPPEAPTPPAKPAAGPRPKGLPGSSIRFGGGDGSTQEQAIAILGAKGESDGVAAEYKYLEAVYGPRGGVWRLKEQALIEGTGATKGRKFDALEIGFGGQTQTFYFDITDYFGKM